MLLTKIIKLVAAVIKLERRTKQKSTKRSKKWTEFQKSGW